jgi:hypothetical protein
MQPQLYQKDNSYYLRFDLGDHYYEGVINQSYFPASITDYIGCVNKAIQNYSTPSQSISGNFNKLEPTNLISSYDITIKFTTDVMNFETIVIIHLTYYKKEQIDYINEQFTDIKNQLVTSENQNKELKTAITDLLKRISVLEDYMSDEEEGGGDKPESLTKKVEQILLPKEDPSSASRRRVRSSNV